MDCKEGNMKNKNTINLKHDHQYIANKKRGPLNMIKIAMFMLRHKSTTKKSNSLNVEVVGSKGLWKRIVGAMRPLHHQLEHDQRLQLPPPPTTKMPPMAMQPNIPSLVLDYSLDAPLSPMGSESSLSSFSNGTVSQYASAQNLQELDNGNNDDDNNGDAKDDGDEMIDAKAEEFIANFYQQMRLQRIDSFNRIWNN